MKIRNYMIAGALALSVGAGGAYAQNIKIGVNQPLTGAFSASGTYVANGAKVAAEEINAAGGVLGQQIQLVIEDNKSNPTEAAAVAEKLITNDKVPVMMGAWGSSLTLAVLPKLMQYKVPMLVETSSSSKITQQGNPYVFRISPPSWVEADVFESLLPQLNIKKVDFLAINNDWGLGTINDFSEMFKENGIEIGRVEKMDEGATELSAQLANIKSSDADTVIVTAAVEQLTLVLKQANDIGLKKQIITTGGSQNPDQLIEQAGGAANGSSHLTFFAPWLPDTWPHPDRAEGFIKLWEAAGHNPIGLTESYRGYEGIYVIAAAIEKAGKAEPEAIREAFWEVEEPAINGTVTFIKDGPEGRESGQYMANGTLVQIVDGKVQDFGS